MKKSRQILVLGNADELKVLPGLHSDLSDCTSHAYEQAHRYCPACGCRAFGTTLACRYGDKDTNRATCSSCGWIGIVHDRVATRVDNACRCKFCVRTLQNV